MKSATVPGGTANSAGEVIAYTINVTNDGNMTLTGPVVSDPSVSDLAAVLERRFQRRRCGHGRQNRSRRDLAVHREPHRHAGRDGRRRYDQQHRLGHDRAGCLRQRQRLDTVEQNPHVVLDKTATVAGGTADAGEVIGYAISVTNDGNVTLTNPDVTDPSVGDLAAVVSGGFNTGDTDHDGNIDVGETWQYSASHTVTQAEFDAGAASATRPRLQPTRARWRATAPRCR